MAISGDPWAGRRATVRSPRGVVAAAILLAVVPVALLFSNIAGGGAGEALHVGLGAGFLVLSAASLQLSLPRWMTVAACLAIGFLGAIFLLQGIADIARSVPLTDLAYGFLGQRLEKALGYVFLLWCVAIALMASRGRTRLVGLTALAVGAAVEVYSAVVTLGGGEASQALKLLYLPIFLWLLLESRKSPEAPK